MTVLIIEDDKVLARALVKSLKLINQSAKHIATYQEAVDYLNSLDELNSVHPIVLLDISLPDGDGVGLAKVISASPPIPYIIAISGAASPSQAFRLKELGVKSFLAKPFTMSQFTREIEQAEKDKNELEETPFVSVLGAMPIKTVTGKVRRTMVVNALQQTEGNITMAANILKITRQGVQNMISEFELDIDHFKIDKE